MLVTVIVLVYNVEKHLAKCVTVGGQKRTRKLWSFIKKMGDS